VIEVKPDDELPETSVEDFSPSAIGGVPGCSTG
jgi:hypothetical protein